MIKKFLFFSLILTSFIFGVIVWGAPDIGLGTAGSIANQANIPTAGVTDTTLSETIGRYINIAMTFMGFIFLILTLYAGFLWMFGGSNEENIAKAKKIFSSSIIGLALVLTSFSITAFVLHYIAGTGAPERYNGTNLKDPSTFVGCCLTAQKGDGDEASYLCRENIGGDKCNTYANVGSEWRPGEACSQHRCYKTENDF